ncbi:MAG: phosphoribosyltransferase [Candidatus Bathyarchaeota archaeon]|nr:MAG: phosphoribosyltransferase [Candidatus Bathyarchaeota archaeon]
MIFANRVEAGERLASALEEYAESDAIVLAIPRGGVVVGFEVAQKLNLNLDIVVPRKIGAPHNPELAIGAVTEDGTIMLNRNLVQYLGVSNDYIERVSEQQRSEIKRRLKRYRGDRPYPKLTQRIVIIVDDGIATGATIKAALSSIRKQNPTLLVVAIPVAPPSIIKDLRKNADRVVCLFIPEFFSAVGQFYRNFQQTSDEEVKQLLRAG